MINESVRATRPSSYAVRDASETEYMRREDEKARKANVLRYAERVKEKKPIF